MPLFVSMVLCSYVVQRLAEVDKRTAIVDDRVPGWSDGDVIGTVI